MSITTDSTIVQYLNYMHWSQAIDALQSSLAMWEAKYKCGTCYTSSGILRENIRDFVFNENINV